jgi:hypothetical protein
MSSPATVAGTVPPEDVLNVNVGVLGHVDSGKTSLVKTLSTLLSTAALDKSKESRQRGITLDLGFSCFFLDMPPHLKALYLEQDQGANDARGLPWSCLPEFERLLVEHKLLMRYC